MSASLTVACTGGWNIPTPGCGPTPGVMAYLLCHSSEWAKTPLKLASLAILHQYSGISMNRFVQKGKSLIKGMFSGFTVCGFYTEPGNWSTFSF